MHTAALRDDLVLLETVIRKLQAEFSLLHFVVDEEKHMVVIPPIHAGFGSIEIQDDCNELIVVVGKFTHWHAGCYREDLSDEEKAEMIAEEVVELLRDVMNETIILWGSHKGGGGFFYRDEQPIQKSQLDIHQKWVWSGPLSE